MPDASVRTPASGAAPFLLLHGLLIPGGLALAAFAVHATGVDHRLTAAFFDPASGTFPARAWPALDLLGYRFAKSAVLVLWFTLLAAALTVSAVPRLAGHRAILWTTVIGMALGPCIVVALKGLNATHCPWDLRLFGGYADFAAGWFVPAAEVGRCFPGGHAAGGFSLVALLFAGLATGNRRLHAAGLIATLAAGSIFSAVRIAQGAHFLSHNLWSASIDWWAAALVFAPLLAQARDPRTG